MWRAKIKLEISNWPPVFNQLWSIGPLPVDGYKCSFDYPKVGLTKIFVPGITTHHGSLFVAVLAHVKWTTFALLPKLAVCQTHLWCLFPTDRFHVDVCADWTIGNA